jgi:Putative esterase
MKHPVYYLVCGIAVAVLLASALPAVAKEEPWSQVEARTKFLRTKHHIEVVRVHSDVYKSARGKEGKIIPGPFPVHVMLPEDYKTNVGRYYGVVYMLGGKSGWDNGPELGGATYWSVWCKTPLTMDNLSSGHLTAANFQNNITEDELRMFNNWLREDPYDELIVVSLWNPGGSDTSKYEKYLIGEVIPFIDAHFRTIPDRRFRGIDGACAGAAQSVMISSRRPDVFGYCGGQQTDLGSYPMVPEVWHANAERIRRAGGITYNFNTNLQDGCNSYSNHGRMYEMVQDMKDHGVSVDVHVFHFCHHGYAAYRYPNGHQSLYWFSTQFKRNFEALGINNQPTTTKTSTEQTTEEPARPATDNHSSQVDMQGSGMPGMW